MSDMIDRRLSEEQQLMRRSCRAFVDDFVAPFIRQHWQREWLMTPGERLPEEILRQADRIGVRTLGVPEEFGGTPIDPDEVQTFAIIAEEIARGDSGSRTSSSRSGSLGAPPERRAAPSPGGLVSAHVADPGFLLAHCLTEPRGASDRWLPYTCPKRLMHTKAVLRGDRWVIDGRKQFISNGYDAKLFVVYANTNPAVGMLQGTSSFLVPRDTPGLTVSAATRRWAGAS